MSTVDILSTYQPQPNRWLRIIVLAAMVFVLLGSFMQLVVGSRFLFFFAPQYNHAGWWTFLCLLPVFAILTLTNERFTGHIRARYPTRWVRRLFMYPLAIALFAGMVVVAPLGWLAAASWAFGNESNLVPARVVSVEEYRPRRGCNQRATLSILSTEATVCLADHYSGLPLKAYQEVAVNGRVISFGFFIGHITPK